MGQPQRHVAAKLCLHCHATVQCAPVVSTPACSSSHSASSCRTYLREHQQILWEQNKQAASGAAIHSLFISSTERLAPSQCCSGQVGPRRLRTDATPGLLGPAAPQVEGLQRALADRAAAAPWWALACRRRGRMGRGVERRWRRRSGGGGVAAAAAAAGGAALLQHIVVQTTNCTSPPVHIRQAAPQALGLGPAHVGLRQELAGGPGGRRQRWPCRHRAADHLQVASAHRGLPMTAAKGSCSSKNRRAPWPREAIASQAPRQAQGLGQPRALPANTSGGTVAP